MYGGRRTPLAFTLKKSTAGNDKVLMDENVM
jgi:hypothetical protein